MPNISELFQGMEEILTNPINKHFSLRDGFARSIRFLAVCFLPQNWHVFVVLNYILTWIIEIHPRTLPINTSDSPAITGSCLEMCILVLSRRAEKNSVRVFSF